MTKINNKPYWLFWLLLAVMAVLVPFFVWHDNTAGFLTDDGTYLLMADFFSPLQTGDSVVQQFMMNQVRFPPAYPVLIALSGGGSTSMPIAHLVTGATFVASAVALYAWARVVLGSRELAAACMAVYALLPKTLVYVIEIWSEFLYMALVLAALILLERWQAASRHSREILLGAALCVGLALLTRTIGIALLAAFVLFVYLRPVRGRFLVLLAAVALPAVWQLIKLVNGYGGGYGEDLEKYLSLEGVQLLLLEDIPANALLLLESWGRHFDAAAGASLFAQALSFILLGLALIGAGRRAVEGRPDVHYAVLYIAIVLVWPYPEHNTRFLYPLVPLAMTYIFIGARTVIPATQQQLHRFALPALVLTMLALIYPNALFVADRFQEPVPAYIPEDQRHTRFWLRGNDMKRIHHQADQKATVIRFLRRVPEHFSRMQCVYASHPVSTMLYAGRISIITPRGATMEKLWVCRYLIAVNLITTREANYPLRQIDRDRLRLIDLERDHGGTPQAFLFKILR